MITIRVDHRRARPGGALLLAVRVALIASLVAPGWALAEPPAARAKVRAPVTAGEARDPAERARRDYARAVTLMDAEDYVAALPLFEQVHAALGVKNALWNMAECQRKLGHVAKAVVTLERFGAHPKVTAVERQEAVALTAQLRGLIAHIEIRANLPGAEVSIDGVVVGKVPFAADVDPGQRAVEVTAPGFIPARKALVLRPGERSAHDFTLAVVPAFLLVKTEPAGASVRAAGRPVGTTPLEARLESSGATLVEVSLAGHRPQQRTVYLAPGARVPVEFSLERQQAVIRLKVEPAGSLVTLDGRPLAKPSEDVAPGRFQLAVNRARYTGWSGELVVKDGESATVQVDLRRGRLRPLWFILAASAAVVTIPVAAVLAVQGRDEARTADAALGSLQQFKVAAPMVAMTRANGLAAASTSESRYAAAATLFAVGGVALAGAGVIGYLTRWKETRGRILSRPPGRGLR